MTEETNLKWISGFWRRLGALIIDSVVLGVIGFILGEFFESTFVQMGGWGRLVGFLISLFYFGILNSRINKGQTIGKKILGIRVVNYDNNPISLGKSLLRYSILATPFILNGAQFSNELMLSSIMYPLSLIVFGGIFSTVYLYIFNRVTRQTLHDLATKTLVVNVDTNKENISKVWHVHLIIVAILLILATIVPAFTKGMAQDAPFKDMLSVISKLSDHPKASYATIQTNWPESDKTNDSEKTVTYVNSQVFLKQNEIKNAELARQFASTLVDNFPGALEKDVIQITLTYAYDIGISSKWSSQAHRFEPSEFKNKKL